MWRGLVDMRWDSIVTPHSLSSWYWDDLWGLVDMRFDSHTPHYMDESCLKYKCVILHTYRHDSLYSSDSVDMIFESLTPHCIDESCRTYKCVMSHIYRHDSLYSFDSGDISLKKHIPHHTNESCRTYEGVTSCIYKMRVLIWLAWHFIPATHPRLYNWVTSHI